MDLTQLNQRIAVANAESQRINNERAVNLGKKETLEKQLQDAITHYNATYNTNITVASLNAEIERVAKEKELEVANIESVLALIKEGRFDEAQQKVSGVVPNTSANTVAESTIPTTPVAQATAPALGDIPVVPQSTTPAIGESVAQSEIKPAVPVMEQPVTKPTAPVIEESVKSTVPVIEEPVAPPTSPVVEQTVTKPAAPVVEQTTTQPTAPNLDVDTTPVGAPPVIGKPPVAPNLGNSVATSPTAPVTSFNAILNGSQFKPQGN